jgi:hypothetical protein
MASVCYLLSRQPETTKTPEILSIAAYGCSAIDEPTAAVYFYGRFAQRITSRVHLTRASAIFGALYKSEPVTFRLRTPVEIGAEQLSRATKSSGYRFAFQEALVGSVTTSRVVLRHYRPLFHDRFAPIFVGDFRGEPGGAVLEGRFTLSLFSKVLTSLWLSGVALLFLWTVFNLITGQPPFYRRIAAVLFTVLLFLFGLAFPSLGWWLGKRDIEYITRKVHDSLEQGGT